MARFFEALELVVAFTLLGVGYYYVRNLWREKRKSAFKENIRHKRYVDEKVYHREFLMNTLPGLKSGKVQWLLIQSKLNPGQSVEVTFDTLSSNLKLVSRCEMPGPEQESMLRSMGLSRVLIRGEHVEFYLPVNSQILIDVIYYIFEIIYGQYKFQNIQIKQSGEL